MFLPAMTTFFLKKFDKWLFIPEICDTMFLTRLTVILVLFLFISPTITDLLRAQSAKPLSLPGAVQKGLQNYQSILAKRNYINASVALVKNTRNEYLPNVTGSIQQNYGTINGQLGPLAPTGIAGPSSAGPSYYSQSWNAAFGASYVINTNWEFFTFGRLATKIKLSETQVRTDSADLAQEEFIQSIKISSAYLNLLAAQRLSLNAEANLNRTSFVQQVVLARTKSGLNAGVDSSIANAQVSAARLTLIAARDYAQQLNNELAQLINEDPLTVFVLDSSFLSAIPSQLNSTVDLSQNPQIRFYQARIDQSNVSESYLRKSVLPGLNLFGIYQARASGFDYNYTPEFPDRFTKNYIDGINPKRSNYVAGLALAWNIFSIAKIKEQVNAQKFITKAYQDEYDLVSSQLKAQGVLADQRIINSLQSFKEVPVQYKAASDAYLQKTVLYKNGLTNIVDVQQALFALNKAETDVSIAYINVWQALLLKSASTGDFELFLNQAGK